MIQAVDFNDIISFTGKKIVPVFMQLGNECFELAYKKSQIGNSWPMLQKIFFSRIYESHTEYIDSLIDKEIFVKNIVSFKIWQNFW